MCATRRAVRHGRLHRRWEYKLTPLTVSVAGLTVTNSRGQTVLKVTPNGFPTRGYRAQREGGEESPVEYIQVGSAH